MSKRRDNDQIDTQSVRTGGMPISVHVDKRRITLPGLRFMGEEPHPAQLAITADEEDDLMMQAHLAVKFAGLI